MTIYTSTITSSNQLSQQSFRRHDIIPLQHNVLWRIECGAVRTLTWTDEGTLIALGYWGPGDVIGYSLTRIEPYEIECQTDVKASALPKALWYQELDAIVSTAHGQEELLNILNQEPASLRVWKFLVWLGKKFGRDVNHERIINLVITQQEIAEVIHLSRVSVTRLLQQFESSGMLRKERRQIVLNCKFFL